MGFCLLGVSKMSSTMLVTHRSILRLDSSPNTTNDHCEIRTLNFITSPVPLSTRQWCPTSVSRDVVSLCRLFDVSLLYINLGARHTCLTNEHTKQFLQLAVSKRAVDYTSAVDE